MRIRRVVMGTSGLPTVSAALICLNEEADLPACLASLDWCNEIVVVVDARTTDRSAEICREAGARVFLRAWDGQTPQKNYALEQCRCDWILSVDADERVTPMLRDEIRSVLPGSVAVGYYVPRRNYWLGRWIRHGGWYPDLNLRLFRREHGWFRYAVHERLEVDGRTDKLVHPLDHFSIKTIDDHLATLKWTDAEVQEMLTNGVSFYLIFPFGPFMHYARDLLSTGVTRLNAFLLAKKHFKNRVEIVWIVPFVPLAKFFHMYVIKAGFRDGWHGFWIATLSAIYLVVKYAKYWSATRADRTHPRRPQSAGHR